MELTVLRHSDPLSDPLSQSGNEHYSSPAKTPAATSSWARHDFSAEPFGQAWSNGLNESTHDKVKESAEAMEPTSGGETVCSAPAEPESALKGEEEAFSHSASEPAEVAPGSPTAPITMRATSSSLSRERSSSTSAIKEGHTTHALAAAYGASVTPRGADPSPFSRFETDNVLSLDTDRSKTPSTSVPIHRTHLDSPAARSARDVDTDLKKMVFQAAASGDVDRLQALMEVVDDSDDYPSAYSMSNWTNGEGEVHLPLG